MATELVALGGLGEVGMNSMWIEDGGDGVVVDAGVMFPERDFGVDVIHPDFTHIIDRREKLRGVVITHGHEDHIGALPYLLRDVDVPVYGPRYALALVRERLREHDIDATLIETEPRKPFRLGGLEIEPIRVCHSIADATAVAIRTSQGVIVHTGDFKVGDETVRGADGRPEFDVDRFHELGREGVRLLLSDSTNSETPGRAGDESAVAQGLRGLVERAKQRVVITLFVSNVPRVRTLMRIAADCGRRVCLLGRGAHTHFRVANETGHLRDLRARIVAPEDAASVPRHELLVLATGSQGEAPAALARLASRNHPSLRLEPGDDVVFSSRIIPGNDVAVYAIMDDLERLGCNVHTASATDDIHVSGHAYQGDQERMIELTEPVALVPIHGAYRHLAAHARLGERLGIDETLIAEDGDVIGVGDRTEIIATTTRGRVHVDGLRTIAESMLDERRALRAVGVVVVVAATKNGRVIAGPRIATRGTIDPDREPHVIASAADAALLAAEERGERSAAAIEDRMRRAVKKSFADATGRRPVVSAVVLET